MTIGSWRRTAVTFEVVEAVVISIVMIIRLTGAIAVIVSIVMNT